MSEKIFGGQHCRVPYSFFGGFRTYSRLRGVWDWLWFSCGVAHCGRGLIAIFRGFFASIGEIFILAGGLGTGLSFYGV